MLHIFVKFQLPPPSPDYTKLTTLTPALSLKGEGVKLCLPLTRRHDNSLTFVKCRRPLPRGEVERNSCSNQIRRTDKYYGCILDVYESILKEKRFLILNFHQVFFLRRRYCLVYPKHPFDYSL